MAQTFRQTLDAVLIRLSLVPGVDTQLYSEAPIKQMIQHKFNVLFDEVWWPQFYTPWRGFALDGVTGMVSAASIAAFIKRYQDIRNIWHVNGTRPIPQLPAGANPRTVEYRCYGPINDPAKVFIIYPITTTGSITVAHRTLPEPFEDDDDIIDLDNDLMVLGTAYDYLNALGSHPAEEEKLLNMFNARLEQLKEQVFRGGISNTTPSIMPYGLQRK